MNSGGLILCVYCFNPGLLKLSNPVKSFHAKRDHRNVAGGCEGESVVGRSH